MTIPVLRTERLVLREWRDADLAPFAALNADPQVMGYLLGTLTRQESDAFVRERIHPSFAAHGFGLWAVERLGMTRDSEDDFDHPRVPPGGPLVAHVLYRLMRERWAARGRLDR